MKNFKNNSEAPGAEEIIDLELFSKEDKEVPKTKRYQVAIDGKKYIFDHSDVTGEQVLLKGDKIPVECFSLYLKLKGCDFELVKLHDHIDLTKKGVEHFITKPPVVFHYFVDDEPETTEEKELTPNQILELAGITPVADYYLVQVVPGHPQISYKETPNVPIQMKCPAMRFLSIFNGETPVS